MLTIADLTPELFMAQMWHDYLALTHEEYMALTEREVTEESTALDIPDALTRQVMRTVEIPDPPILIIAATEDDNSRGRRREIVTSIMLRGWLKAESAPQSPVMSTREQIAAVIRAAQRRCMNDESWQAYLNGLSEETLTGWTTLKTIHGRIVKPTINEQLGTLMQGFAVRQMIYMELDAKP